MPWHEIRTRAGQEISKRVDVAMYRAGIAPAAATLPGPASSDAKFFFEGTEARYRANLVKQHLPCEAAAIVDAANSICRHEFYLLGYDRVCFDREINWHFGQGRRRDLRPWYKIDFLDFAKVGDHKIVWELNRHQHLVTLAKAWLLTGKAEYVNELVAQWYSWQKANPYPFGINWASSLEVGFRSISWLWVRSLLDECPELPGGFESDLWIGLQLHGRHIERYLSTYFSPNTHLLGEAVALLFIGTLCPESAAAHRWRARGWNILLEESGRQVREDGMYFEQALYYHVYALDFFLHARILASNNGFAVPGPFDSVLNKMLDVVQALSASGAIEGFGDDDGGRFFNPRRNRVEHMSDPLALGTVLYGSRYSSANLTEESIWLFGDKAVEALADLAPPLNARSIALPAGGVYLICDSEPLLQQLMIDAGPQGIGHSGHGHADALSIRMSLGGQRFLVDCGTYCYVAEGNERDYFRGTGAHNTLRVDSTDQAVPWGPFAWDSIPNVKTEKWVNSKAFDFFEGSHNGYCRLPEAVVHRRSVFHVKGGSWLLRDMAEGTGKHLLETFWHFAPEVEISEQSGALTAMVSPRETTPEPASLTLLIDRNSDWVADVTSGFVSPVYGLKQTAPVLRLSTHASLPEQCAVLLLPQKRVSEIGEFTSIRKKSQDKICAYRYRTVQACEFFFFADGNTPWSVGNWTSDALLLYCQFEGGKLMQVIMVSGTFADWRGKRFISHPSGAEIFEWRRQSSNETASGTREDEIDDSVCDLEFFDSVF